MTATPTFTAQEMRDLTSSPEISPTTHGICHTQMCSEERCGTCSRKAAIRAALRHAATVGEENERLKAEAEKRNAVTTAQTIALTEWGDKYADEFNRAEKAKAALAALREQYHELLYAVEKKYEGESRHATALRYITEREALISGPVQAASDRREP